MRCTYIRKPKSFPFQNLLNSSLSLLLPFFLYTFSASFDSIVRIAVRCQTNFSFFSNLSFVWIFFSSFIFFYLFEAPANCIASLILYMCVVCDVRACAFHNGNYIVIRNRLIITAKTNFAFFSVRAPHWNSINCNLFELEYKKRFSYWDIYVEQ